MAYAERTEIAVEKSLMEIVGLVKRAGAERVGQMEERDGFVIQFFLADRMIRFRVTWTALETIRKFDGNSRPLSDQQRRQRWEQAKRQRARALLLVVKAKLESVASDVETFEEAFLANIVLANGATLYERVQDPIALEYSSGAVVPMLPWAGGAS